MSGPLAMRLGLNASRFLNASRGIATQSSAMNATQGAVQASEASSPAIGQQQSLLQPSLREEDWLAAVAEETEAKKRRILLAGYQAYVKTRLELAESQAKIQSAQAKIQSAESQAKLLSRDIQSLRVQLLFAHGLLNMRGAYETVERDYMNRLGIKGSRHARWQQALEKDADLYACIQQKMASSDTKTMATCLTDIYKKLLGHNHHYQLSLDAVDVVVGILDNQEASVLECTLKTNNIPVRIRHLLADPDLKRRLDRVEEEEEEEEEEELD